MIIIIISIILLLLLLTFFLYIQKKKVMSLQQQIGDLQNKIASVDKGIRGFSRGKTTPGCVILVGGRQPTCLVCLTSRRLSAVKNSKGLAGTPGALPARQRTQACWRKSRTITPQAAFQPCRQARVPLSTDA